MHQEESCSPLLPEWGRTSGGCACSGIHVKPFGTSRIPGHSAEINDCYSEVSTSRCQSKKCNLCHLEAEHLGMLEQSCTSDAEEIPAAAEPGKFLLNVFSATVFLTLGTIQHLIYASMTSCVTQNFSGGNPNTTIHKTATKSLNPSFQNNARASLWARCFGISYV